MRILLLNSSPVVGKLVTLSAQKTGDELQVIDKVGSVPAQEFDLLLLDDEFYTPENFEKITSTATIAKSVLIAERGKEKPADFVLLLEKPFLPTDLVEILLNINTAPSESLEEESLSDDEALSLDDELSLDSELEQEAADLDELSIDGLETPAEEESDLDISAETENELDGLDEFDGMEEIEGLDALEDETPLSASGSSVLDENDISEVKELLDEDDLDSTASEDTGMDLLEGDELGDLDLDADLDMDESSVETTLGDLESVSESLEALESDDLGDLDLDADLGTETAKESLDELGDLDFDAELDEERDSSDELQGMDTLEGDDLGDLDITAGLDEMEETTEGMDALEGDDLGDLDIAAGLDEMEETTEGMDALEGDDLGDLDIAAGLDEMEETTEEMDALEGDDLGDLSLDEETLSADVDEDLTRALSEAEMELDEISLDAQPAKEDDELDALLDAVDAVETAHNEMDLEDEEESSDTALDTLDDVSEEMMSGLDDEMAESDDLDALVQEADALSDAMEDELSAMDLDSAELDDSSLYEESIEDEEELVVAGGEFASLTEEALSEASSEENHDLGSDDTFDSLTTDDLPEIPMPEEENEDELVIAGGEFASLTEEALSEALGEKEPSEHVSLDEELQEAESDLAVQTSQELPAASGEASGMNLNASPEVLQALLSSLDNDQLRTALKGMKININISFDDEK